MFERTIRTMGRWILVLAFTSGCSLLVSANVHHNSRGSACVASPAYGLIDIAIAGISAAAIGASEASWGWYTMPGVFGASGLIGVVSAARCAGDDDSETAASNAPPASNSAPSFGEAPVDPEAREATHEEIFGTGVQPTVPPTSPLPAVTQEPAKPPPPAPTLPTCTITPRKDCPDGYYCQLVAENRGECIKMN